MRKELEKFQVRMLGAQIYNFKNVEYGQINFASKSTKDLWEEKADILGIYGQNGSGKTAFISAISILQELLSGKRLSKNVKNYIMTEKEKSKIEFEFLLTNDESKFKVKYIFSIKMREEKIPMREKFSLKNDDDLISVFIDEEKLSFSEYIESKWTKSQVIIMSDYASKEVFVPKSKFLEITQQNQEMIDELRLAKRYSIKQSTSFIFSEDAVTQISENCSNQIYRDIIEVLAFYGRTNLFVIDNSVSGLINADIFLPFSFKFNNENSLIMGRIPLEMSGPTLIPEEIYESITKSIETSNIVLRELIPGLSIELKNLGKQMMEDNEEGRLVELISKRNDRYIPLNYESDGIKKIISILHMLIAMYNDASMTLAIDELDSGIFEYLLGELLSIIEESGKGQLIFTSHNLRPLEKLNKKFIIFTTCNPKNRYFRLKSTQSNNNLRRVYYHDIVLGGQKECLYDITNNYAIARAFRKAGEVH